MATITDYLAWRGDLTLDERPFNTVDNIVLSTLAYVSFGNTVPPCQGPAVRLADVLRKVLLCERASKAIPAQQRPFLGELAHARRFADARLHSALELCDADRSLQFAALCIDLPKHKGTYVAFRGTDNTLAGWREDFLLGSRITGAQRLAARYLRRVLARHERAPLFVGGHSKGANLALFASLTCPSRLREHITRVYCNDGPGIAPEVLPLATRASLGSRLVRLVPQFCLVGSLFEHPRATRIIVRSKAQGALQHDATTWLVGADEPLHAEGFSRGGLRLSKAICSWIAGMSIAERELVVQEVFDALAAGGATYLDDVFATPASTAAVLQALRAASTTTRRAVRHLVAGMGCSLLPPSLEQIAAGMRRAPRET